MPIKKLAFLNIKVFYWLVSIEYIEGSFPKTDHPLLLVLQLDFNAVCIVFMGFWPVCSSFNSSI